MLGDTSLELYFAYALFLDVGLSEKLILGIILRKCPKDKFQAHFFKGHRSFLSDFIERNFN